MNHCKAARLHLQDLASNVEQLQAQHDEVLRQAQTSARRPDHSVELEVIKETLAEALQRMAELERVHMGAGWSAGSKAKRTGSLPADAYELEDLLAERMDERDASLAQLKKTVDVIVADLNKLALKHVPPKGDGESSVGVSGRLMQKRGAGLALTPWSG